jgi:hypothetical protein
MLVFIKRVVSKRFEWCWKEKKKFYDYSGINGSLFRLRLRLLHVMLDVVLIVCLVVFAIAWLVPNDWDCLMSLWKKSCVVFIIWEHIFVVFSFDALSGLTWRMLTPCLTLTRCHKPLWSFGFWLVIPLYILVNDVLSLCMIMAVIALLVGRSQSFASLHFILRGNTSHASNSQKSSLFQCVHLKVSYAFMFCYSMKDKLKTTLLCFSIWLEHTLDFQCFITHDLLFVLLFML